MADVSIDFKPRSWSFSAIHQFEECPLNYVLNRLDTSERETSYALEFGLHCHTLMENYLKGIITGVPKELKVFEPELKKLLEKGALAEEELVINRNWEPIISEDKWKSRDAWIRGKTDARLDNLIIDLKTGRQYDHYAEQADLYATMLFQHTDYDVIDVEFWYSKTGDVVSFEFVRSEHEEHMSAWDARASKMMQEQHWLPKENAACRWCSYHDKCELKA